MKVIILNRIFILKVLEFVEGVIAKKQRNGYGIIYFKDGAKYIGHIDEKGDFQGKGIYIWKTGDRFEGNFYRGNLHGFGIFYSLKGTVEESKKVDKIIINIFIFRSL